LKLISSIVFVCFFLYTISLSAVVSSPRPTALVVNNPELVNQEIVNSILDWIAAETSYPRNDVIPDIRFANQAFMEKEWEKSGGDKNYKLAALTVSVTSSGKRHVTTYIPIRFNWENHQHLTYLVHELVHLQQYIYYVDVDLKCKDIWNLRRTRLH